MATPQSWADWALAPAWRIALNTLRGRLREYWGVSLLLAAPLAVLGITAPAVSSYDIDCVFSTLVVILLLQRLPSDFGASGSTSAKALLRSFIAGAAIPLPLFFKQNIGLPILAATFVIILLLWIARQVGRGPAAQGSAELVAILGGAVAALLAACLLLHFTCGLRNYIHWTIEFAARRRLPGFADMLGVYAEPSLLAWLPAAAAALALMHSRFAKTLWARLAAVGLLAAPFVWTLAGLLLSSDADDRGCSLLALWPLVLVLSGALTLWSFTPQP